MKHIILIRHAEALPSSGKNDDSERALSATGKREASRIAQQLVDHSIQPDTVLCSPATRTCQTYTIMAELLALPEASYPTELYLASVGELVTAIQSLPDSCQTVCIIGHQPGLQLCALTLASVGDPEAMENLDAGFPTATAAVLSVDDAIDWSEISPECARLALILHP